MLNFSCHGPAIRSDSLIHGLRGRGPIEDATQPRQRRRCNSQVIQTLLITGSGLLMSSKRSPGGRDPRAGVLSIEARLSGNKDGAERGQ